MKVKQENIRIAGTFNPYFDKAGFLVTIFNDGNQFLIQDFELDKFYEYEEVHIELDKLNPYFELISEFYTNAAYHAFKTERDNKIKIGLYHDLKRFLKTEIDYIKEEYLRLMISEFFEEPGYEAYYRYTDQYRQEHGKHFDFAKATAIEKTVEEYANDYQTEELSVKDLKMY